MLLGADLLASYRRDGPVSMAEAAGWTLATVALAVCFGALLARTSGSTPAGQFFAGWLTEYSLSLDNLLVFVILISRSQVPDRLHGRVVLAGIGIAVVLRGDRHRRRRGRPAPVRVAGIPVRRVSPLYGGPGGAAP